MIGDADVCGITVIVVTTARATRAAIVSVVSEYAVTYQ